MVPNESNAARVQEGTPPEGNSALVGNNKPVVDGSDGQVFMADSDADTEDLFGDLEDPNDANPNETARDSVVRATRATTQVAALLRVEPSERRLQLLTQILFPLKMYLAAHRDAVVNGVGKHTETHLSDEVVMHDMGMRFAPNAKAIDERGFDQLAKHGRLFIDSKLTEIEGAITNIEAAIHASPAQFNRAIFDAIEKLNAIIMKMTMRFDDENYSRETLYRKPQGAPRKTQFSQQDALLLQIDTLETCLVKFRQAEMANPEYQHVSDQFASFVILLRGADQAFEGALTDVQDFNRNKNMTAEARKELMAAIVDIGTYVMAGIEGPYGDILANFGDTAALEELKKCFKILEGFSEAQILPLNGLAQKIKETRGVLDAIAEDYRSLVTLRGYLPMPSASYQRTVMQKDALDERAAADKFATPFGRFPPRSTKTDARNHSA